MGQCQPRIQEPLDESMVNIQDLHVGCMLINDQGIIQVANTRVLTLLKYDDVRGMDIKSLLPKDIAKVHDMYIERFKATKTSKFVNHVGRFVHPVDSEGKSFECFLTVNILEDGFVAFFQDMSEGIRKLVNSKGVTPKTTEHMIRYLNFEVREPLQGITMGLEAMRDGVSKFDQSICDQLLSSCKEIVDTFDRVREFESVLTDEYKYIYTLADMINLVRYQTHEEVIELAAHKSLEIVSEFDPTFDKMFVYVDRAMLSKAISYSYRYMCQKCTNFQTLTVRLTCDEILVSPNKEQVAKVRIGICIDLNKKTIPHVMRWWDEKKTKDSLNSNELNMLFVEQIVCAGHNGSITHVKHADLYGIELCINTTLKPRPQEHVDTATTTPIVGDLSPYTPYMKKQSHSLDREVDVDIVYIDDSYILQKGFAFLAKKHGWTTKTFDRGTEAIEWFKHHKSKIILVDKIMPGLDGIDTVKQLSHHNIPIIGITGDSHDADNQEMVKAGAVRVLIKPVTRDMLTIVLGQYFT